MKLSLSCVQVQLSFLNKKLKKKVHTIIWKAEGKGGVGLECSGVDCSTHARAALLQNMPDRFAVSAGA